MSGPDRDRKRPDLDALAPQLEHLASLYEAAHRKTTWAYVVLALIWIPAIPMVFTQIVMIGNERIFAGMAMLIGLAVLSAIVYHSLGGKERSAYRRAFKEEIVGALVAWRYPDAEFHPGRGIQLDEFVASQLFRHDIDRFDSEDLIEGRLGHTSFRSSELRAEYCETVTDDDGHTRTTWHTIFEGVFFIADFNKTFAGELRLGPDRVESLLGSLGIGAQRVGARLRGLELIRLEDREFERRFVVYGSDQVEARYILSPKLTQRLSAFRDRFHDGVWLSFVDDRVFIAIESSENRFEPPPLSGSALRFDDEQLARYLEDIRLAEDIIEQLDLNTRIWSKAPDTSRQESTEPD